MKREIIKNILPLLPIVAAAVSIYFYFVGTADASVVQVLIPGLLIGLNIFYCSALLNKQFPALAKQLIVGMVVVSIILILTDHGLDVRPRMLQILIAFMALNFILYLAARRKNTFSQPQ